MRTIMHVRRNFNHFYYVKNSCINNNLTMLYRMIKQIQFRLY